MTQLAFPFNKGTGVAEQLPLFPEYEDDQTGFPFPEANPGMAVHCPVGPLGGGRLSIYGTRSPEHVVLQIGRGIPLRWSPKEAITVSRALLAIAEGVRPSA